MLTVDEKIKKAKEQGTERDKIKLMIHFYNTLYNKWVDGGRCDEITRSKVSIIELTADVFGWPIEYNRRGLMCFTEEP